ncbi:DUF4247 domain-containing protein [Saccharopolyspora hirsuta]|uniref:DUF4247 domain-containing protein n=1 Tax=Saccharopolyspora hirsuta TaxID=1837 RepID=A0A5M7BQP7_SACHI|nr:DUF4247 domain-containing protein [Saccharopolyspora hirsuta]KAA5829544.1 DUF4247 domain-containing protein [Saccharopolyspora hirsuta]MBF6511102.1 DUF4247 domain-containing protein [Nocardia farcinica]
MKPKFWFAIAGAAAVLALIVGMVTLFSTGTGPRGYVANNYTRAAHLDLPGDSDNRAYTSPLPPTTVAFQISSKWRPQSQYTDSSGIYLRYSGDAVVVKPHQQGSVIHVMDAHHAYRRYHSHVGGVWGWSSPHGESFRGRGPGAGK